LLIVMMRAARVAVWWGQPRVEGPARLADVTAGEADAEVARVCECLDARVGADERAVGTHAGTRATPRTRLRMAPRAVRG
jgi:hypothetical protein